MTERNHAELYDRLIAVEEKFLAEVEDDEIQGLYLAARRGNKDAFRALVEIAMPGWGVGTGKTGDRPGPMNPREAKADTAIEIFYWVRRSFR
jgi:hypothetical protein